MTLAFAPVALLLLVRYLCLDPRDLSGAARWALSVWAAGIILSVAVLVRAAL